MKQRITVPYTLKISEIFYSIQGEGVYIGYPAIFIRLAGCSMGCPFCDTKYSWNNGKEMLLKEIIDEVEKYPIKRVVITGGEPLEQDISGLVNNLLDLNYEIHIETNGSQKIPDFKKPVWLTVSPKFYWLDENIQKANEVKLVITSQADFERFKHIITKDTFLVPVSNDLQIAKLVVDFVKKNGGRVGWQLQKTIKVE